MIKDIRCTEINNNPLTTIPEYFEKGWLGGNSLWNFWKNIRAYKKSQGKVREILNAGIVSEESYILAAEDIFLYGRAGMRIWGECVKRYVVAKIRHQIPADSSNMFVEVPEIVLIEEVPEQKKDKKIVNVEETVVGQQKDEEIVSVVEKKEFRRDFKSRLAEFDKEHIWMFDAGLVGRRSFSGNPKYLFVYINKYRPDICAYWICENDAKNVEEQVKKLGYDACSLGTEIADYAISRTGVVVSELLRESYLGGLSQTKYVNLWHGIGFKHIERGIIQDTSDLRLGIAKKYISNNTYLQNNQLVVVTSPIYEEEFKNDLGVNGEQLIRSGYLRCLYQKNYERICTYEHDILGLKGLATDTKLAVYTPTYRAARGNAFVTGMKDLERLHQVCEENRILLIFKVHPQIEKEQGFLNAWQQYGERPYFLFWDNKNDFYEIMDQIDLVIYDYSSMFSDFLCAGVKHYIRYIYDEDEYMAEGFTQGKKAYYERTCGKVCHTYDDLLKTITDYENADDAREIEETYQKLWAYAGDDDFEKTIQAVMDFRPAKTVYPTLYSFDIFDTLISRKGLHPYSIFHAVKERMKEEGSYPVDLVERYPAIRHSAEMNVREYYKKTTQIRHSEKLEIQTYEIFDRLAEFYGITKEQSRQLMDWEIEEEINSVVPLKVQIDLIKQYLQNGDKVVLISDMYLPKEVIQTMLKKAEPVLAELPLFVSSEYGYQKTTRLLYFEVYRSFKPYYQFGKWIHYGDNPVADKTPARRLGIHTVPVKRVEYNSMEQNLVDTLQNYNAYLTAAMCARMREEMQSLYTKAEFVIDIVGMTLVPYVDWVIRDAMEKGFEQLVFVARDGHPLKLIADALIQANNWKIETKYIYASRRTWRIQSYFDEIDEIFWIEQGGSFNDICSKEELLKALYIDEEKFRELMPQIDLDSYDWNQEQPGRKLASVIRKSEKYEKYLLEVAAKKRELSCAYLKQELDETKKFACVEYWGRGYNQECMARLWNHVIGREDENYYYYARTIHPTEGKCIRYHMTNMNGNVAWMEAVFANMPYRSIEEYENIDGMIKPIFQYTDNYDHSLFDAMEGILPKMAQQYAELEIKSPQEWNRKMFDFAHEYVQNHKTTFEIAENVGSLYDSMSMHGNVKEYARAYKETDLEIFSKGIPRAKNTQSIQMSYTRASEEVKRKYDEMYQIETGDDPAKGVLLNKNEITANQNFKVKYKDTLKRAELAAKLYEEACESCHVYNKVCVVSATKDFQGDTLKILSERLREQQEIYVEWLTADRNAVTDGELMQMLAMAKYVIVDGNVVQLLKVKFRKGTTCINLLDRGFRLYRFGRMENVKLKWQYRYNSLMYTKMPTLTEHTSLDFKELCGYDMELGAMEKLAGVCVTDVLFDNNYKMEAFEKIWSIAPESKDKKIIFYMPQPRKRKNSGAWMEMLDLEKLVELLGEQYFVFVDLRSNKALAKSCKNKINIPGFSKNVSDEKISLRSLLVAADVVVGDYRDSFFESVLLNKPVFSTAIDLHEVQSNSVNMMYDLAEIYPFPIVETAEELVESISKVEEYDYQPLEEFRKQYLTGCDGKSSDRVVEHIVSENK